MTLNQFGAIFGIGAVVAIFMWHNHERPKVVPVSPPVVAIAPEPKAPEPPKPTLHPLAHSTGANLRQVLSGGRKGNLIRCESTEPVPAADVAEYTKILNLTTTQVKTFRVCKN